MQEPVLLTYNLEDAQAQQVKALARSLGIAVRPVPGGAHQGMLQELLDQPDRVDVDNGAVPAFAEAMIVMCHFPRPLLNALLDGFREKDIPPVSLMAVLTPTNSTWTSAELYAALSKERAYFASRQEQDGGAE